MSSVKFLMKYFEALSAEGAGWGGNKNLVDKVEHRQNIVHVV